MEPPGRGPAQIRSGPPAAKAAPAPGALAGAASMVPGFLTLTGFNTWDGSELLLVRGPRIVDQPGASCRQSHTAICAPCSLTIAYEGCAGCPYLSACSIRMLAAAPGWPATWIRSGWFRSCVRLRMRSSRRQRWRRRGWQHSARAAASNQQRFPSRRCFQVYCSNGSHKLGSWCQRRSRCSRCCCSRRHTQ